MDFFAQGVASLRASNPQVVVRLCLDCPSIYEKIESAGSCLFDALVPVVFRLGPLVSV